METGNALNELTQLLKINAPVVNSVTAQQYVAGVTSAVSPVAQAPPGNSVSPVAEALPGNSVSRATTSSESPDSETDALIRQLAELTNVAREQAESTEANTLAVVENSVAQASGTKASKVESVGKTILSFLGSGFGIAQVLDKIFSSQGDDESVPTTSYMAPTPLNVEAGITGGTGGLQPIQYGQAGLPRPAAPAGPTSQTPVTIQVQALDSRSIIDHSSEIADAVKEALLNSHSLNDVVTEI